MKSVVAADLGDQAVGRAIGLAILAYFLFSTSDALVKGVGHGISVFQVAFTLSVCAYLPVVMLTIGRGGPRTLLPVRWPLVLARGVLTTGSGLTAWASFRFLPLAESYAILFAAPIIITALSHFVLHETVGWRRWVAASIGFVGLVIMINPHFETLALGHAIAACSALFAATSFIVLRKIGATEKSPAILFVLFSCIALATLPGTILTFQMPVWHDLLCMVGAGLAQGTAQATLVLATRRAPASLVAPFQYSQMIWALVFGLAFFHYEPGATLYLGMAIVIGSGLYTIWRETVRRTQPTVGVRGEVPARAAREPQAPLEPGSA